MLHFLYTFFDEIAVLNVFKYITFRSFGAGVTSFVISVFLGGRFINFLKTKQFHETIREDGPTTHHAKKGTPTMGGLFIVVSIVLSAIIWTNLSVLYVWMVLSFTVGFALIGYLDDRRKMSKGKGISARSKFLMQISLGLVIILILVIRSEGFTMSLRLDEVSSYPVTSVLIPFFKKVVIDFGWLYIPFAIVVVVGASNAVNLTDGLDGLAIGSIAVVSGTYLVFSYLSGNIVFARYLQIPYIAGSGELAVFLSAVGGACLGFLWYNSHPAQVFMGDVGSLALGAAIGSVAVIIKQEILLTIVGGLFVLEVLSVVTQVLFFKLTGKRLFRMAPLHHHFELCGWSESKVVIRFWIISLILALVAFSTLKIR
jgi:phospho-N-acetylmuramoyl-pentapeptide-transferase